MPTYPRIYNNKPRKMVKVMWVASVVVERGEGDGFWARESPQRNKEKVGSILEWRCTVGKGGGGRILGVAGGEGEERRGWVRFLVKMINGV